MTDRSILYRLRAALQGGYVAVAAEVQTLVNYVGVLSGINDIETALRRLDGTGVGAALFNFSGAFSATAANINDWFGGRQLVRLRCIGRGTSPVGAIPFDLPGTAALNTAFDQLQTLGIAERLQFVIEYTGAADSFVSIRPRIPPSPQITGATSVTVRMGTAATIEVTRTNSTISDYVLTSISAITAVPGILEGALTLISPTVAVWDASPTGILPSTNVVMGNAYQVVNAPSDGSGRFGEVMQNGDWVVWQGESFSSWAAEPHQWFVLAAHDVRRISALENEFLNTVAISTPSERNAVIRGANYADTADEIRLQIYATPGDYTPADLNTNGDIDEYTDPTSRQGRLAIRLSGTQATLASVLPTLYVYSEDSAGNFTRLFNLASDFTHQGDFVSESDYLSNTNIDYNANDTLRIYVGQLVDRYNSPNLDISESNLTADVQEKLNADHPGGLPAPLEALNNGANVFNITHTEYRANNPHIYLNNTLAALKNAPSSFPVAAGTFVNEIVGSATTVSDPTPVTSIQDVSALTNDVMTGAGIVNNSFRITTPDENNWRLVIGGWLYYETLPSTFQPILRAKERISSTANPTFRDIFGIGPNGIVFRARATTGNTVNIGIRHRLTSTNGLPLEELTASTLSASFRVYSAETFSIQVTGRNGGVFQGAQAQDYTVTDIGTSQAETTLDFNVGAGTQTLRVQYDASSTLYGGSAHIITVTADSLIAGIDQLDVDILSPSSAVTTSGNNTYSDLTISGGHAASGRLMRYIASFRSIGGLESGNLECVLAFAGYDDNGQPRVFEENTFDLLYPALDLNWDYLLYGGQGVHQNVQAMVLNADTPLIEYPRHSTEDDWIRNYDRKADQWVWGNVHGPDQDTEVVYFPESVEFPNQLFVSPDGTRYRITVDNAGTITTTQVT